MHPTAEVPATAGKKRTCESPWPLGPCAEGCAGAAARTAVPVARDAAVLTEPTLAARHTAVAPPSAPLRCFYTCLGDGALAPSPFLSSSCSPVHKMIRPG